MGSTKVHYLRSFLPVAAEADAAMIRCAARQLANYVCVVTTGAEDARSGRAASSVSLLCAEPARLLICLDPRGSSGAAFARSASFAVNVLGGDQREIAEQFAGSPDACGAGQLVRWALVADGLAGLADCAAVFECEVEEAIERHARLIIIGRVRRALIRGGSGALVRWRGAFDQLGWSRDEIARAVGLRPSGGT